MCAVLLSSEAKRMVGLLLGVKTNKDQDIPRNQSNAMDGFCCTDKRLVRVSGIDKCKY